MQYLVELLFLISRTISVSKGAKFLQRKPGLAETTCRGMTDEIAENWKGAPQSEGLESKDYLHIGFVGTSLTLSTQSVLPIVPTYAPP